MSFDSLGLSPALCKAVLDAGYDTPTPVQVQAIPAALLSQDLMVSSSTGSGKTAAFVLPALEQILQARATQAAGRRSGPPQGPSVLVLAPTRELALQVAKAALGYGRHVPGLRVATVLGGVPYAQQLRALRGPLDILIATPGRLLDHLSSGKAVLSQVRTLVLDEADRMLDMGFIDDIRTIAAVTPTQRQTVMFSATFGGHVGRLAADLLREPVRIDVASHTDTHAHIEQRLHWADDFAHKNDLLDNLLAMREIEQALVFASTQRDAESLAQRLEELGHSVAALHGGMPQGRRNRTLTSLRHGRVRVLVATDVAARGIDVPTISHVINFGLPMKAEDYVHHIGRTGRAGRSGLAITLADHRDQHLVRRIERFTTQPIPVATVDGLEPRRPAPSERPRPAHQRPRFGSGRPGSGRAGASFAPGSRNGPRDGMRNGPRRHADGDRREAGGQRRPGR